jgi:uncharacterized protein YkwD
MLKISRLIINLFLVAAIVFLGYLGWYFYLQTSFDLEKAKDNIVTSLDEVKQEVNTPGPLVEDQVENEPLTVSGIIKQTNKQREKFGLPVLSENFKLDNSAKVKALDMIKKDYFAHESPTGLGVGDLVENEGYSYLIVGENLARGEFDGDKGVVEAWMNSPGHRANILNESYLEIGAGVVKGDYQGETVWMAVQHFATSKSVCSSPSSSLKSEINKNNSRLEELKVQIEQSEDRQEYNQLVREYNNLLEKNKNLIEEYNRQVREYNQCLQTFN